VPFLLAVWVVRSAASRRGGREQAGARQSCSCCILQPATPARKVGGQRSGERLTCSEYWIERFPRELSLRFRRFRGSSLYVAVHVTAPIHAHSCCKGRAHPAAQPGVLAAAFSRSGPAEPTCRLRYRHWAVRLKARVGDLSVSPPSGQPCGARLVRLRQGGLQLSRGAARYHSKLFD
jgi:hypothetical protein